MKYIDAEILYREVDRLMAHYATAEKEMEDDVELSIFYQGKRKMCSEIIDHITALQEEQPEVDLKREAVMFCIDQGINLSPRHAEMIARHFYSHRNEALEKAAQYAYESWMGGTMDDFRRDIVELGKVLKAKKEE